MSLAVKESGFSVVSADREAALRDGGRGEQGREEYMGR